MSLPEPETVFEIVRDVASRAPDTQAVMALGRRPLTYGGLFELISTVTGQLGSVGVRRNDRVAIVLPQGPEAGTCFLAVAAGYSSAPLNPGYRANELEFYLSDLRPAAVIVHSDLESPVRDVARRMGLPLVELTPRLDGEAGVFDLSGDARADQAPPEYAEPLDVALVLHTSGTTSRPKMVPLTHANICSSAHNIGTTLELTERDRCLNIMPLFHIHGLIGATLSSISAGATIACASRFSVPAFYEWMEAFRPTWYTAVPTMHQAILEQAAAHRQTIEHAPLRFIRSSSSALPPRLMAELESHFGVPVIESYGMTEASHQMTSNPLPPRERKAGSTGVAAGPEVAILGEQGAILSTGEVGEIVIRGPSVTRGYENQPEANRSAFVAGWFRTGDQGYLDADGYLFITGRLKEMVNRGGENIAPREIDEVLLEHPGVRQAVAFAVPHPSLGEDLAVAVVPSERGAVTESAIRGYLFDRLADFKVPSQVLIVDEIPKGATGKLRRIGLSEELADRLERDFVAPQGELQTIIAEMFAKVLGVERVGAHDNFFVRGGDSLRATRVIASLRSRCHVNLPIVTLFRKPTVAELADEVARSSKDAEETLIAEILDELNDLSEDEARRLLDAELGQDASAT